MGIFDKAKDLITEHNDAVDKGIDKGSDLVDERTGGTHGAQIDQGAEALKERLDGLGADRTGDEPAPGVPANEPPAGPPVS